MKVTFAGKASVMSYEDLEQALAERAAGGVEKVASKGKGERGRSARDRKKQVRWSQIKKSCG